MLRGIKQDRPKNFNLFLFSIINNRGPNPMRPNRGNQKRGGSGTAPPSSIIGLREECIRARNLSIKQQLEGVI